MELPSITVVIPTYNRAEELSECLAALSGQEYPSHLIEIIIVDGFSTDKTRQVAEQFGARVLDNPDVIHPKGRPVGIRAARGELILCLDSDNIIPEKHWLKKLVEPFSDHQVVAAEPLYYFASEKDNIVTRYCALIGGDDPIVIMLGFNERFSYLTGKWTGVPVTEDDMGGWLKIDFKNPDIIPSLGANGFIVRKEELAELNIDPFHHVDVSRQLISKGKSIWAKVKIGIIHKHGVGPAKFIAKKRRRAERRMDKNVQMGYSYPIKLSALMPIVLKGLFLLPIFYDAICGWLRKKDRAWIFHPFAFYGVLAIYGFTVIRRTISRTMDVDYEKV